MQAKYIARSASLPSGQNQNSLKRKMPRLNMRGIWCRLTERYAMITWSGTVRQYADCDELTSDSDVSSHQRPVTSSVASMTSPRLAASSHIVWRHRSACFRSRCRVRLSVAQTDAVDQSLKQVTWLRQSASPFWNASGPRQRERSQPSRTQLKPHPHRQRVEATGNVLSSWTRLAALDNRQLYTWCSVGRLVAESWTCSVSFDLLKSWARKSRQGQPDRGTSPHQNFEWLGS